MEEEKVTKKVKAKKHNSSTPKVKKERKRLNNEEKELLKGEIINYEIPINYTNQYSDKFYDLYIANFEENRKKKYFYRFIIS